MKVSIFKGVSTNYGFTNDATGSNLPTTSGPWKFLKNAELHPSQPRNGMNVKEAMAAIAAQGFYVTGAEIKMTEIE